MYKVAYSYKQDSPSGGNTNTSGWTKAFRLYDAENAEELQSRIDQFLSDDHYGYRKYITVINITKL